MKGFYAFAKKEFTEQLHSYKALILTAVLFLFGMMSPLLAKLLPDIIGTMDINGMTLTFPEPTALDAYVQFFKNVGQLGLVALLLIFSGLLSQDVTRGTLVVPFGQGAVSSGCYFFKIHHGVCLVDGGVRACCRDYLRIHRLSIREWGYAQSSILPVLLVAFRRFYSGAFTVRQHTCPRQLRRPAPDSRDACHPARFKQLPPLSRPSTPQRWLLIILLSSAMPPRRQTS